jgi:hypothetical protein
MRLLLALVAALLVLAGCGSDGDTIATDPGGRSDEMPTAVPAAQEPVRTRSLATVMDTGSPVLCLGPVAESYPPQCDGPPLAGWDWADHRGTYEAANGVRWGAYNVGGTWDGTTFTATDAVSGAVYDPAAQPSPTYPTPATLHSADELASIDSEVAELPGVLTHAVQDGHVLVDVIYDDGSLQDRVDEQYGDVVVVLTSMLLEIEG